MHGHMDCARLLAKAALALAAASSSSSSHDHEAAGVVPMEEEG